MSACVVIVIVSVIVVSVEFSSKFPSSAGVVSAAGAAAAVVAFAITVICRRLTLTGWKLRSDNSLRNAGGGSRAFEFFTYLLLNGTPMPLI